MKNLAVKYLCTGIVTFVTLCGGMSVSAQNLVVQNPGILVTKPAGITSVLTPERSIHTDAGITASLRNARDEAMVTKHKADVVKLQSLCQTNEVGLRVYDGRFTIAVGTYFNTAIGQYFDLVLENGTVIPCIMGDLKADIHTDSRGLFTEASGCMTEFIVDRTYLPNKNSATYCYEEWNSKVVNVIVYNKFVNLE